MKIIAVNKKAGFDYFIEEKFEAGIVLEGAEVKSLRLGNCNLGESFVLIRNGFCLLKNCHISPYQHISKFNSQDPKRDRILLLHKYEISKMTGKVNQKGYTIVPLKIYFQKSLVKVEIALCRGKLAPDKRKAIAERELDRQAQRDIKEAFGR